MREKTCQSPFFMKKDSKI